MTKKLVREGVNLEGQRVRWIGWWLLLAIVVATIAGSWYFLQLGNELTPPDDSQAPPRTLAPHFFLMDLEGVTFELSDFRGRIVVINFMTTWCGACRAAIPHYETIWEQYANTLVVMSIDVDPFESEETLRSFANEFPDATWIWAKDAANLRQTYHITAIPSTVIIDQEGYIRFTNIGVTDAVTLSQEIEQLLQ